MRCICNSGRMQRPLYDARLIFVAYVCDECERKVRGRYRPEVFTDPNYETTEDIEE
jgi:hypothetical protein